MPTMITLQEARRKRQKVAREAGVISSTLDDFDVPDGATGAQATAIIRKKVGPKVWSKLLGMSSDLQRSNYLRGAPKSHKRPRPAHLRSVTSDEPEAPKPKKKKKPLEPEADPDAEPDFEPDDEDDEEDEEAEEEEDMPTPDRKAAVDLAMSHTWNLKRADLEASHDAIFGQPRRISSDAKKRRPRRRPKRGATTDRQRLAAAMKHPAVLRTHQRSGVDLKTAAEAFLAIGFDPYQA